MAVYKKKKPVSTLPRQPGNYIKLLYTNARLSPMNIIAETYPTLVP